MAYDDGHAQAMREALDGHPDIAEKKMFGGLCFMLRGNMLCGVHKGGGMVRIGKANEAAALALDGVDPLSFTGRKMGGMVDIDDGVLADDARLAQLLDLAMQFVGSMPAK
jgi:hypothetical protein